MVTSGAFYRKRNGVGETRSMTGGLDGLVFKNFRKPEEDVRSLHFSYSVTSEVSKSPSRRSSFRIRKATEDKDEFDGSSVISDGVHISFYLLSLESAL